MINVPADDKKAARQASIMEKVSFLVLGFALAFICTLAYWSLEQDVVFTGRDDVVRIVDEEVRAGETLSVALTYCKLIDGPVQFTRTFINESTVISNPPLIDDTGKGCVTNRMVEVPVPKEMATGDYQLRYTVTANLNPIKEDAETEYYSKGTVRVIGIQDQWTR